MNARAALLVLVVLALAGVGLWSARAVRDRGPEPAAPGAPGFVTYRAPVMATTIQVEVPAGPSARAAADTVFGVFREVDARMSEWKPTSPLSAVNREAGKEPVPVPGDLRAVIRRGLDIGEMTGGAFDLTWAALWGLWDFRSPDPAVPDSAAVAARVALVDYRKVRIDDDAGTVYLPVAGMKIGLGGIAKGYALDRSAQALAAVGVADYLVLGGGQVLAGGTHDGRPWSVGIRDPRGGPQDYFATLELVDASASTSGDYESYFIKDGIRYSHILDPRTGYPARRLRSATVVSADATLADALSTALMVMGREAGMALVERLPGVEAVVVDERGEVASSPGLRDRLVILHRPRTSGP